MNKQNLVISCIGTALFCAASALGYSAWIVPSATNYGGTTIASKNSKPVVAYIKNGDKKTYYTSVETAVIQANSKDSVNSPVDVWVIPNTQYTITSSFTIDQYVNLNLPFQDEIVFDVWKATDGKYTPDGTMSVNATNALSNPNSYRKTLLSISSGIIITNNGTINVGGIIGGQGGGSGPCGQTCSFYSEIKCLSTNNSKAQIINKGLIKNQGCISGLDGTTFAVDNISGSTFKSVLILGENRGGSALLNLGGGYLNALTNKLSFEVSPFNTVYMVNLTAKSIFRNGCSVLGLGSMFGDNKHNQVEIELYSPNSSSLFQSMGGYLISQYQSSNNGKGVLDLDFFGDHSIHYMKLSVTASKAGITLTDDVKTDTVFFPLSYVNDISFNSIDGAKATISSSQDIKIMPGGKLTIGKNVDFSINQLAVYDSSFIDPASNCTYEVGHPDGVFELNGTANIKNCGGFITAGDEGASLNISNSVTVVSKQIQGNPADASYKNYSFNAFGKVSTDSGNSFKQGNFSIGKSYVSSKASDGTLYWPVDAIVHKFSITAKSYSDWKAYYYPAFNFYIADNLEGLNKTIVSSLTQTKTSASKLNDSSISMSAELEEGKYFFIESKSECDQVTGVELNKWIEITKDFDITITAQK